MTTEIGRDPEGSGSRPSDGAASVSTLSGFDPSRCDPARVQTVALSMRRKAKELVTRNAVAEGVFGTPRALLRRSDWDEIALVAIDAWRAIAMDARQGTAPKGLDGEAATARAEGIALPTHPNPTEY